tara:strand:- start:962 stop:1180 length:219 start_codon:yes stop_codon:yes gene_type:complete
MYTLVKNTDGMLNEVEFSPLLERMTLANSFRDAASNEDLDMTSYNIMSMEDARKYYKELLVDGYKVTATRSY